MRKILLIILTIQVFTLKINQHNHQNIQETHLSQYSNHYIEWDHFNSDLQPNSKLLQPDWLKDIDNSTSVSLLSIPGTHHSGASNSSCISGWKSCTNWHETQSWSIFDQLKSGIRFIQLGLCQNDNPEQIRICHAGTEFQLLN